MIEKKTLILWAVVTVIITLGMFFGTLRWDPGNIEKNLSIAFILSIMAPMIIIGASLFNNLEFAISGTIGFIATGVAGVIVMSCTPTVATGIGGSVIVIALAIAAATLVSNKPREKRWACMVLASEALTIFSATFWTASRFI